MDFTSNIKRILFFKTRNIFHVAVQTDLHSKDESLIDTKRLLGGDQQRRGASERAREEEALIIHLSSNNLVRAIQHSIREGTYAIPVQQGGTQSNQVSPSDLQFLFCIVC